METPKKLPRRRASLTPLTTSVSSFTPGKDVAKSSKSIVKASVKEEATLPESYSKLLKRFMALELFFSVSAVRDMVPSLKEIVSNMRITGLEFSLRQLQQILTLAKLFDVEFADPANPTVHQLHIDGTKVVGRLSVEQTEGRRALIEAELTKRVDEARAAKAALKEPFDIQVDCPVIEALPMNIPEPSAAVRAKSPATPSETPKAKRFAGLEISASPHTPVRVSLVRSALKPRDHSLTPSEQIELCRKKVRESSAARDKEAEAVKEELVKASNEEDVEFLLSVVTFISGKMYGLSSRLGLDVFIKEAHKALPKLTPERIEKLLRKLAELHANWLKIEPSKFSTKTFIVRIDNTIPASEIQNLIRQQHKDI